MWLVTMASEQPMNRGMSGRANEESTRTRRDVKMVVDE